MQLQIANRGGMCSTLCLSACPSYDLKRAVVGFKNMFETYKKGAKDRPKERVYDHYSESKYGEQDILDGYDISDYAFMTVTTHHPDDIDASMYAERYRDVLKTLGFTQSEDVYNKKNGTHVAIHTIGIPDLIEELSKYDKHGVLIPVKGGKKDDSKCAA